MSRPEGEGEPGCQGRERHQRSGSADLSGGLLVGDRYLQPPQHQNCIPQLFAAHFLSASFLLPPCSALYHFCLYLSLSVLTFHFPSLSLSLSNPFYV